MYCAADVSKVPKNLATATGVQTSRRLSTLMSLQTGLLWPVGEGADSCAKALLGSSSSIKVGIAFLAVLAFFF